MSVNFTTYFYVKILCRKMQALKNKFIIYYKIMKMCVLYI